MGQHSRLPPGAQRRARPGTPGRTEQAAVCRPPACGEDLAINRDEESGVRAALSRLPRHSATVLVLRHSGLSYAEVADAWASKSARSGRCCAELRPRYERSWTVRHVPDGTLRRITDEPLAVADRDVRHMTSCARCQARRGRVAGDATFAEHIFSPRPGFSGPTWHGPVIRDECPNPPPTDPACTPPDPPTGVLWVPQPGQEWVWRRPAPCSPAWRLQPR